MALIMCPECQKEISDQAAACPYCGFPIAKQAAESEMRETANEDSPSSKTESFEKAATKRHGTLIAIIAVAVLAIAVVLLVNVTNTVNEKRAAEQARAEYLENLKAIKSQMFIYGLEAERAGTLVHDVWYNTIYEKSDLSTDKYTKQGTYSYKFNSDFNTSLSNLFSDESFAENLSSIRSGSKSVSELYGKLQNPPEDLQGAYSALNDLYDAFQTLTKCATDPSGNLTTYTSTFNQADSDFAKYYEKFDSVIPDDSSEN